MEYLLIFISAIFVNNIVLSQFLGICPFLGVSKKDRYSYWYGWCIGIRSYSCYYHNMARTEIRSRCTWNWIFTDISFYPYHRCTCADGGDNIEKSVSHIISGIGNLLTPDYHKLLCAWCCNSCDSKGLQSYAKYCIRFLYSLRICTIIGSFCRNT